MQLRPLRTAGRQKQGGRVVSPGPLVRLAAILLLAASPAFAQDAPAPAVAAAAAPAPTPVNVRNAGAVTCAQFAQIFSATGSELDKTAILQWVAGFSTAVSGVRNIVDVFPLVDTMEFVRYIALVCGESDQALLRDAVIVSINRLEPFWIRSRTDTVEIQSGAVRVAILAEAVAPLQTRLTQLGFPVAVDGVYGSGTGTALNNLLTSLGVAPSLLPDGRALYVLTRP
jgi:hypothetical protein